MSESESGMEVQVGDKKAKIWGDNLLQLIMLLVLSLLTYASFKHDVEAAEKTKEMTAAIKEQTKVLQDQLSAQREANCLNRLTTEQKKQPREIDFCQSLGRGR